MSISKVLLYILIVISCSSCNRYNAKIEHILALAGNNRYELEKLLEYYKENDLKYKAACYLIENLEDKYSIIPENACIEDAILKHIQNISDSTGWDPATSQVNSYLISLSDKESQKLLRESPDLFFAQYDVPSGVDIKKSEFKLLFALTDDEILKSLKHNDIQTFLRLCKERNYFTNIEFSEEILKLSRTISEHPEIQESLQGLPQVRAVYLIPFAAVAAAAVYVVVVYSVGAGINWAAGVVAWLEVMVASRSAQNTMIKSIIKDENILKLWINKDMTIQKRLIEEYARQIIEADKAL